MFGSLAKAEDDGEIFQVRKSSHSKKVMRMMDKERRKKKREERAELSGQNWAHQAGYQNGSTTQHLDSSSANASGANSSRSNKSSASDSPNVQSKSKKCDNDMIQTEIRTDDFVVRLLLFNFFYKNNKITYDINKLKKRVNQKFNIKNEIEYGYVFGVSDQNDVTLHFE